MVCSLKDCAASNAQAWATVPASDRPDAVKTVRPYMPGQYERPWSALDEVVPSLSPAPEVVLRLSAAAGARPSPGACSEMAAAAAGAGAWPAAPMAYPPPPPTTSAAAATPAILAGQPVHRRARRAASSSGTSDRTSGTARRSSTALRSATVSGTTPAPGSAARRRATAASSAATSCGVLSSMVILLGARALTGNVSPHPGGLQSWACLLYTSDAADD